MNKKTSLYFSLVAILLLGFSSNNQLEAQSKTWADWVDPFIGTGGHGHTYPGAVYPFGLVQLSPDTRLTGWDGCSAYHHSDTITYGFSHTHLSGTGVSDYGDILLMPYSGSANSYEQDKIGSIFSHSKEEAKPGFYKCHLDDYNIGVELTVTERCGFHRYTFNRDEESFILLDLIHRDFVNDSYLKIVDEYEIEGYRYSNAWATNQKIHFVMRFSMPIHDMVDMHGSQVEVDQKNKIFRGDSIRTALKFKTGKGDYIYVKVGISAVDIEGARKNLQKEIPNWNFSGVKRDTKNAWNEQLSKIQVFGGSPKELTIFYTALYHTMIVPNVWSDVDNRYRGMDDQIHTSETGKRYTIFSLWDTYRATHPLYTLIEQERTGEFINTFLGHYEQSGLLPVWELAANETNCMIGTHGVSVIADAIQKGIGGFDQKQAYKAMKASLEQDKHELNMYRQFGYMPSNEVMESVSKTLEFAYDDWCLAITAKKLGKKKDYEKYLKRAQFYKNLLDPETGFMRPKLNGSWRSPFDPKEVDFNYTEANSWQYSFYVPQDVSGMIRQSGGSRAFEDKLDRLFTTDSETTGRHQADITGLIGQYAHGNEPSHHMAYLYNYIGKPEKTQAYIKRIREEMYSDQPDGYSGNEDCGQMSAWYVFSALGFYPVTPGSNDYIMGLPLFPRVVINFENGKHFSIENMAVGKNGNHVKSVELNHQIYSNSFISHEEIMKGGKLVFVTGDEPGDSWGKSIKSVPVSEIDEHHLVISPFIKNGQQTFRDNYNIELVTLEKDRDLYYRLGNGKGKYGKWQEYAGPVYVEQSGEIEFYAVNEAGEKSLVEYSRFMKIDREWTVEIKHPYGSQYTGGGPQGLIDKIRGKESFANGSWQGYEGVDFEVVLDFGEILDVSAIEVGFLQSIFSWIWLPKEVSFYSSENGEDFRQLGSVKHEIGLDVDGTKLKSLGIDKLKEQARFIKVVAKNIGTIPDWHPGAGGKAWIFVDEIIINP